jgi:hypothetical protein
MAHEYLTVSLRKLVDSPNFWQSAKAKEEEFADLLTDAFNTMAQDRWNLVTMYGPLGTAYAVFRRERDKNSG